MKIGDKYIIEIEEVIRRNGAPQIARVKGFNALVFDKNGLEKLEPYELAEDTAYQKGYNDCERVMDRKTTEVYNKGYEDGKNAVISESEKITSKDISDAYDKGLNDAWECARKIIGGMHSHNDYIKEKRNVIFGTFDRGVIMHRFSASEAIVKIKEYEDKQKQDAGIKVGDEIVSGKSHVVVTYISPEGEWNGFSLNKTEYGEQGQGYTCMSSFNGWRKTYRHFPQIAEVLEELRGE